MRATVSTCGEVRRGHDRTLPVLIFTHVCLRCSSGWESERPVAYCPDCKRLAKPRGARMAVSL